MKAVETDNPEQYQAWNGASGERWVRGHDVRERILTPFAALLADAAAIAPGERVLDVGCGCGPTTRAAAAATGEGGSVVGLDLSGPMLAEARRTPAGGVHVEYIHADAQTVELRRHFDVAISRFGTMFFSDPAAAFSNIARHLDPGGRLCMLTWQHIEANQWFAAPAAAVSEFGTIPAVEVDAPGIFGLSRPQTIASILGWAGFDAVEVEPREVQVNLGPTADEAADYLAVSGLARMVIEDLEEAERELAMESLRRLASEHLGPDGVSMGAAVWLTRARVR